MQLKYQRDFFLRQATASDRDEVINLVEKHQGPHAVAALKDHYVTLLGDTSYSLKVFLNSNGVLIGVVGATRTTLEYLAVNPNFLKKEVKDVILTELRTWSSQANQSRLTLVPKIITGDWKTFVKQSGVKVEERPDGLEELLF